MLENSRALGAIETTQYERMEYARDSLEFNLKDSNFTTLFPDLVKEIQEKLHERQVAAELATKNAASTDGTATSNDNGHGDYRNGAHRRGQTGDSLNDSSYGNLVLIISFCLFALIVHHIYNSDVVND